MSLLVAVYDTVYINPGGSENPGLAGSGTNSFILGYCGVFAVTLLRSFPSDPFLFPPFFARNLPREYYKVL